MKNLFSTPVWLTLILSIAIARSSGVKNHAVAGESGNQRKYATAVASVMTPVIIKNHCQGENPLVWICKTPNERKPDTICAVPFIKTGPCIHELVSVNVE